MCAVAEGDEAEDGGDQDDEVGEGVRDEEGHGVIAVAVDVVPTGDLAGGVVPEDAVSGNFVRRYG